MRRQITASEVREGMEVRWSKGGITYQMQCQRKVEFKHEFLKEIIGYNFCAEDGGVQYVSADQAFTVLAEPQPDEPTAFGACVEVGGVKYVRAGSDVLPWTADETPHEIKSACTWRCLTNQGHVTVINADPFASTEPREPRVWERIEDVPALIPFRAAGFAYTYRKTISGMERLADDGIWVVSGMALADFADYGSFAEARYV